MWRTLPPSSDSNDGGSSEAERGRLSTSKHIQWSDLDEQHLLAYKRASLGTGSSASSRQDSGRSTHALEHDTAQSHMSFLHSGQAAAQALCAYLSLGLCWDKYLMRTSCFYQPVPTREHVRSREAAFRARRIGWSDACVVEYHKENREVGIGSRQAQGLYLSQEVL